MHWRLQRLMKIGYSPEQAKSMSPEGVLIVEATIAFDETCDAIRSQIEAVNNNPFADKPGRDKALRQLQTQLKEEQELYYGDVPYMGDYDPEAVRG